MVTNQPPIKANKIFMNLIIFTFLDALVDKRQTELEGETLRYKYDKMPKGSEFEIIFRDIYRIFKVIRNASVHAQSRIHYVDGGLEIAYEFKNSQYRLNCSNLGVKYINSLIFFIARSNIELNKNKEMDHYTMAYLRFYYHKIRKEIADFKDDIDDALSESISLSLLKTTTRYRVSEPIHSDKGKVFEFNKIVTNNPPEVAMGEYFLRKGDKKFIIPVEALDPDNCITKNDFFKWEVKDTNYLCESDVDEVEPNYYYR